MSDTALHPQPTDGTPPEATAPQADSLVGLMDQLILPPDPAPIPLTPETAGWYVLGALLLCGLGWLLRRVVLRRRANAYRRAALAELARAGEDAAAIATVLRRTALAAYPRGQVAGLTGADWVAFLTRTGPFPEPQARALARAPYAPGGAPVPGLAQAARDWIRQHERGAA